MKRLLFIALVWSFSGFAQECDLKNDWDKLLNEAKVLSGKSDSFRQRTIFYHEIYLLTKENYDFLLLANHGGLQIIDTVHLGKLVPGFVYPGDYKKRLDAFQQGLMEINRNIFVYLYAEFYLIKRYGNNPKLKDFISSERIELVSKLLQGKVLSPAERKELFIQTLKFEQEKFVVPNIMQVYNYLDTNLFDFIIRRPNARLSFFPRDEYYQFNDFLSSHERMKFAIKSWDLAELSGPQTVVESLGEYKNNLGVPFVESDELTLFDAKKLRASILNSQRIDEVTKGKKCF